ncbi:hypothetical protein [Butyrivibrio sp. XPD2002]|uniref:hypothetical protein n=1 Tax=Butyrivibrio sp. XPD2002 TaxID=1280665 RepID=UPI0012DBD513|nr:hypothetical protein [Butyrivibrio sp. XPD2002]
MKSKKTINILCNWICIAASLLRIWVSQLQNISVAVKGGGVDGWLQVKQTASIAGGNWLGTFDSTTLVKEVGFPIFGAMIHALQISYGVGVGLLLVICACLMATSLRPYIKDAILQMLFYLSLLYCPVGFRTVYIYRSALLIMVPIGLMASAFALFARRNDNLKTYTYIGWGLIGFIFGGLFWILKEDSVWIIPFLFVETIVCIIGVFSNLKKGKTSKKVFAAIVVAQLLPFCGMLFANHVVTGMNEKYYNVSLSNERTKGEFPRLCGLLYRIDVDDADIDPDVWIARSALEQAVSVSDKMASLDTLFDKCESAGSDAPHNGWPKGDISTWAIRSAADEAGYYESANKVQQFYKEAADEIQKAFDDGRLKEKKGITLSKYVKPFTLDEIGLAISNSIKTQALFALHENERVETDISYIDTTPANMWFLEKAFGVRVPLSDEQIKSMKFKRDWQYEENNTLIKEKKCYILAAVGVYYIYRYGSYVVLPLSILGFVYLIYESIRRREKAWEALIISAALLLTSFSVIFVTGLFSIWMTKDAASSPYVAYAPSAYMILEVFKMFSVIALIGGIRKLRNSKNKD